jgi:hypothetical protein
MTTEKFRENVPNSMHTVFSIDLAKHKVDAKYTAV